MTWQRRRVVRAALIAFGAGLGAAACSVVAGLGDYHKVAGDGGTTPAAPTIRYQSGACDQCMMANCAPELADCESDTTCAMYAKCSTGCDLKDGACSYQCAQLADEKNAAYGRLVGCEIRLCASSGCWSCGEIFSASAPTCAQCAIDDPGPTGLCALTDNCLLDTGCNEYVACLAEEAKLFGRPDPAERLTCGGRYPEQGRNFYSIVGTRYFLGCTKNCSAGQNWNCTQPTAWPAAGPSGSRANITLHVPTPPGGSADSAVSVRACAGLDYACANPIGGGARDSENGVVVFDVAQSNAEGAYFFEFSQPGNPTPFLIYSPWQPIVGDITLWTPPPDDLTQAYGAAPDGTRTAGRGTVVVEVVDCVGGLADYLSTAPLLTISGPPGVSVYYINRQAMVLDVLATGGGAAYLLNVVPGSLSIRVERGASHDLIANAIVPIRADVETKVSFNYPQFF